MTVQADRVWVSGEVDLAVEPDLRERLSRAAEQAGPSGVVVDVRDVSFMDCVGVRLLMGVREQVEQAGGRLVLAGPSPVVSRLVGLVGLSDLLPVLDDRAP